MSPTPVPKEFTAIVILAPHEVQVALAPYRLKYGFEGAVRVPAHISLILPFVQLDELPQAEKKLRKICKTVAPFDITLKSYQNFPYAIFLVPQHPQPIIHLFEKIYAAFPDYPPYAGAYGNQLAPHMTIAEFKTVEEREAVQAQLPPWKPMTFRTDRIHILHGSAETVSPTIPYAIIHLGAVQ